MSGVALMIVHQTTSITGRLGALLESRGYTLDVRCPQLGHELPDCLDGYCGIAMYGGPMSANDDHLPGIRAELDWLPKVLKAEKPFVGLCLGAQILARCLGAEVTPHPDGVAEIGYFQIRPMQPDCQVFPQSMHVYQWHREGFGVADGAVLLAAGDYYINQAFRYGRNAYGFQFHPEVTAEMMERWLKNGAERLKLPGAQQPPAHYQGRADYDAELGNWLARFLDNWVEVPEDSVVMQ